MAQARLFCPIILIILLGFGLRLHKLDLVPLRGDEAFSAQYWAGLPLSQSLLEIAPKDPHPPLAFIVFRLWRHLIGGIDSVFALRLLTVLGNSIGVPACFALGWRLSRSRGVGWLTAMMWALHPFLIWHSQDFRNYALWAGLSVTGLWLAIRCIQRGKPADLRAYGPVAAAAGLMFYAEATITLALALLARLERPSRARLMRRLLLTQGVILAAVILCFVILQAEPIVSGSYGGNLQPFAAADYVRRIVPALAIGDQHRLDPGLSGIAICLLLALAALALRRADAWSFRLLAALIVLPLFALGLVSLFRDVFHPRYVLATIPAFILLMTLGAHQAASHFQPRRGARRELLTLLLLAPWFALAAHSLGNYYSGFHDPTQRKSPAWDELGAFLSSRVAADDLVIQLALDPAFGYYYRGAARDIGLPVRPDQPAEEIIAELVDLRTDYHSIYVVAQEQAGWPNAGVVVEWMRQNMQEALTSDASGLPIRQFMPWQVERDYPTDLARFSDTVALVDAEVWHNPLPSGELLVWLLWRPLATDPRGLKSFVHIYAAEDAATLWTQDDVFPQGGRLSSVDWQAGQVFREAYYLPLATLAPGSYKIETGWYDPGTGKRLETGEGSNTFVVKAFAYEPGG